MSRRQTCLLTLIRGLPGSGKTTFAGTIIAPDAGGWLLPPLMFAADDYFTREDGRYEFNAKHLGRAHKWCQDRTKAAIRKHPIIVHNTFSTMKEMNPYISMTTNINIIDLYDAGLTDEQLAARNTHGVPQATITKMRARWVPQTKFSGRFT